MELEGTVKVDYTSCAVVGGGVEPVGNPDPAALEGIDKLETL